MNTMYQSWKMLENVQNWLEISPLALFVALHQNEKWQNLINDSICSCEINPSHQYSRAVKWLLQTEKFTIVCGSVSNCHRRLRSLCIVILSLYLTPIVPYFYVLLLFNGKWKIWSYLSLLDSLRGISLLGCLHFMWIKRFFFLKEWVKCLSK
jgi:hypothetical protein